MSDFTEEQEPKFDFPIPDDWPPSLALAFAQLMEKALADGFPLVVPVRKDATPEQITSALEDMRAVVRNVVWRYHPAPDSGCRAQAGGAALGTLFRCAGTPPRADRPDSRRRKVDCGQSGPGGACVRISLLAGPTMADSGKQNRVVIVGAGFAGFNAARELSRRAGASTEIVVINSTDYFLYLPLMPQLSGGLLEPAHIRVSLARRLRKMRFVLGTVDHVDPKQKVVHWAGCEGTGGQLGYDRLILTAGSVNKLLPIPGLADYAHGFRSIAEAMYLHDHTIRQLELGAVAADPEERRARCTFVVVGAGYTGTEVTAQGQLLTTRLAGTMPGLAGQPIRWLLLDTAPRLLPGQARIQFRQQPRRGVQQQPPDRLASQAGHGPGQPGGQQLALRGDLGTGVARADDDERGAGLALLRIGGHGAQLELADGVVVQVHRLGDAAEPVRVVGEAGDGQQLVHAARGQDEPVVAELPAGALAARPVHHLLLRVDMVHRAQHEPHLAQPPGQRDPDMGLLQQPTAQLRHQRQVEEVIRRVDHHDLGAGPGPPGQFPRRVEAGEASPDDHHTVLLARVSHRGSC